MDPSRLAEHIREHRARRREAPVAVSASRAELLEHLQSRYAGFERPLGPEAAFDDVTDLLWRWSEHAQSPRHFGLTRPTVDVVSVIADALAALYDPNLATWDFGPAANEIERHTLAVLGERFGSGFAQGLSHFTSGGQESNHTAVAVALTRAFPEAGLHGLRALGRDPLLYLSAEGHHSFDKIAHVTGLGRRAVRLVPVDAELRLDVAALVRQIEQDLSAGCGPFLVVGTAGTINAGVVDPLAALADVAERFGLWFHVDAAWGGAAIVSDRLRGCLAGIERADSISCDAHKLFSVPAGAGMFFCRHPEPVAATFATQAAYVPDHGSDGRVYNYVTSMQWSRRFIGLKLFLMLAVRGLPAIARRIEHQAELGERLRSHLVAAGFELLNQTPLPVVAFTHPRIAGNAERTAAVVSELRRKQVAWISKTALLGGVPALRASITNYESREEDVDALIEGLVQALGSDEAGARATGSSGS